MEGILDQGVITQEIIEKCRVAAQELKEKVFLFEKNSRTRSKKTEERDRVMQLLRGLYRSSNVSNFGTNSPSCGASFPGESGRRASAA